MNKELMKNQKIILKKTFSNWWRIHSLEIHVKYKKTQRHKTSNNRKNKKLFSVRIKLSENLLAIEMKKTQIFMNKPVYLDLSILELSKVVMYEFWYI